MSGGAGNDTLNGGAGTERFVFSESGPLHQDTLVDFSHTYDTIVLQDKLDGVTNTAITGLVFNNGVLNSANYFEGAGLTGNGLESSGIFNDTTTGNIYYNPTSGFDGDAAVICTVGTVTAASLDNTDFVYSA